MLRISSKNATYLGDVEGQLPFGFRRLNVILTFVRTTGQLLQVLAFITGHTEARGQPAINFNYKNIIAFYGSGRCLAVRG